MENLNKILSELGISKVRLAKYLGVSRQMLYNYLGEESMNDWPKEKSMKMYSLLGITGPEGLDTINVDGEYIIEVEGRLNASVKDSGPKEVLADLKGFSQKEQELLSNIINLLKERLQEDKTKEAYNAFKYLYYFLQNMETTKEEKYILGYMVKSLGLVDPNEYVFNEQQQFTFESIMFSAMALYASKGASKTKIAETHKKFVQEIEHKKEERLSRTQELNTAKIQALRELGYDDITTDNAKEVLDKIAEIQARKII